MCMWQNYIASCGTAGATLGRVQSSAVALRVIGTMQGVDEGVKQRATLKDKDEVLEAV